MCKSGELFFKGKTVSTVKTYHIGHTFIICFKYVSVNVQLNTLRKKKNPPKLSSPPKTRQKINACLYNIVLKNHISVNKADTIQ